MSRDQQRDANRSGLHASGWWALGPKYEFSRVRAFARWDNNTQNVLGSAGGGIFLRPPNPPGWNNSWNKRDLYSGISTVSDVKFNPFDSSQVYVSTGDGYGEPLAGPREHKPVSGTGIYRSFDGGSSFQRISSTAGPQWSLVNKITFAPNQSGRLFAATGTGLYRTNDFGDSWTPVLSGWICDMDISFSSPQIAVASVKGVGIFKSADGGENWTLATEIPADRIELSIARTPSPYVYASVSQSDLVSLWKSSDSGSSFAVTSAPASPTLGGFSNAVQAIDGNPLHVVYGGKYLYRSLDGGASASIAFTNQPHHVQSITTYSSGFSPSYLWICTNGGLVSATYTSSTLAGNFYNLNCSQVNFLSVSRTGTRVGGANTGVFLDLGGGGIWSQIYTGNGGPTTHDWTVLRRYYTSLPSGQVIRSDLDTGVSSIEGGPNGITDTERERRNYYPPILLDPNNPDRLYTGRRQLWRTENANTIAPDWSAVKGEVIGTGDPGQYDDPRNIAAFDIAKSDSNVILVAHNNGEVWKSIDATGSSPSWVRVGESTLPMRKPTKLIVSQHDADLAYISYDSWEPGNIWRTMDGGLNWTNIGSSLPAVPVFSIACHPVNREWLYIGTEVGLLASENYGGDWGSAYGGPGVVRVTDIKVGVDGNPGDYPLYVATYGMGVFKLGPSLAGYSHSQPESMQIPRGRWLSGGLGDVMIDDDNYLRLLPTYAGQRGAPNYEVVFESDVLVEPYARISLYVLAGASLTGQLTCRLSFYDYQSGQWVDGQSNAMGSSVSEFGISSFDADRFVGPNGEIKARLQSYATSTSTRNVELRIDRVMWEFQRG